MVAKTVYQLVCRVLGFSEDSFANISFTSLSKCLYVCILELNIIL